MRGRRSGYKAGVTQVILTILFMVAAFIPIAAFMAVLIWERRLEARRRQVPFRDLRRRPAGEALRIKVAELDEKLDSRFALLAGPPVMAATLLAVLPGRKDQALAVCFLVSFGWTAFLTWGIRRILKERRDYRLGFDGERYVAEELSRLIAAGYEIFHDVPFDGFNIDHVLVGPAGVFAVETKTRRKPVAKAGGKDYHVRFDGAQLIWPWGADGDSVRQAVLNGRTLGDWLSSAVGERVNATPILALPGWMVDRLAPPKNLFVANPKEIAAFLESQNGEVAPTLVRRICHQLDQKCRIGVD
jgi:Nuclease-related domain